MNTDEAIREALIELARERGESSTFCPSEAARRIAEDWRPLMPMVRTVAAELIAEGKLTCTQRGNPAHPLTTPGAIRLASARQH